MAQLKTAVADILKAAEDARRSTEDMPSVPIFLLCTSEAYDDFISRQNSDVAFAQEAACVLDGLQIQRLATTGGRNEKELARDLLTAVLGHPYASASAEKSGPLSAAPLCGLLVGGPSEDFLLESSPFISLHE
ncbi:hypothetical protein SprV_0401664500 [Sparganum proliferum]